MLFRAPNQILEVAVDILDWATDIVSAEPIYKDAVKTYSTSAKVYALGANFRVFVFKSPTIHPFHSFTTQ